VGALKQADVTSDRSSSGFLIQQLADLRERLTDEGGSNAESLGHKSIENGLEYRQRSDLPRLDEHAKRSADYDPTRPRDLPSEAFVDEKQIGMKRLREEDGCGFAGIQSEVDLRQGAVDDTDPAGLAERIEAGHRWSSLDHLVPDCSRHDEVAKDCREQVKNPNPREVDQRGAFGDDHYPSRSAQLRSFVAASSSRLKSSRS